MNIRRFLAVTMAVTVVGGWSTLASADWPIHVAGLSSDSVRQYDPFGGLAEETKVEDQAVVPLIHAATGKSA